MLRKIRSFRTKWLEDYFLYGTRSNLILTEIESALSRKLDIINAAEDFRDLRSPPGNRFEALESPLDKYYSIRVNKQYRLIFQWIEGKAEELYLSPHKYTDHK